MKFNYTHLKHAIANCVFPVTHFSFNSENFKPSRNIFCLKIIWYAILCCFFLGDKIIFRFHNWFLFESSFTDDDWCDEFRRILLNSKRLHQIIPCIFRSTTKIATALNELVCVFWFALHRESRHTCFVVMCLYFLLLLFRNAPLTFTECA